MEDKIQAFRQPLVTATGIILGFILNFASSFVKSESSVSDFTSYVIGFLLGTDTATSRMKSLGVPMTFSKVCAARSRGLLEKNLVVSSLCFSFRQPFLFLKLFSR